MNTQQALLDVTQTSLGSLPEKDQVLVFSGLSEEVKKKIAANAIANMSPEDRRAFLSTYPEVPASSAQPSVTAPRQRGQFAEVYSGEHCKLEVRSTKLGREVRLTLNAGSTLEKAFDEINAKSQEKYGRDAIYKGYRGNLYKDAGVKDVIKESTVITFIPVLKNSEYRVRFGTNPKTSHSGLLNKYGLDFVDRRYQTAAAGAYRIAKGFQSDVAVGLSRDKGDLFEGKVARSRRGVVGTRNVGVIDFDFEYCVDDCRDDLVVSGRTPSNSSHLFCSAAFSPKAKHMINFIKSFLKR